MPPTSARVAQEVYEPLIGIQYPMRMPLSMWMRAIIQKITLPCKSTSIWNFFPRVRTPCGHGAQVCSRLGDEWQIGTTSIREDHLIASGLRVVQWYHASVMWMRAIIQKITLPCKSTSIWNFFHEYGRRVGMVPRSSLKGGKVSRMVEKKTRTTNNKKPTEHKTKKAHRPRLHHHVVFPLC